MLQSHSGHYIALLLNHAGEVMPAEIHQVLDPYLNQLQTELAPVGAKPEHPAAAPPAAAPAAQPGSETGAQSIGGAVSGDAAAATDRA